MVVFKGRVILAIAAAVIAVACERTFAFDQAGVEGGAGAGLGGNTDGDDKDAAVSFGGAGGTSLDASMPPKRCHDDCEIPTLHCEVQSGQCLECLNDEDCGALDLTRCDTATHRCVECGLDQDCATDFVCEPRSHRCVHSCDEDNECDDPAFSCNSVQRRCEECKNDDECETSPRGSRCPAGGSRCVECTDMTQCPTERPYCDPIAGTCVACRDSRDCVDSVCAPSSHHCID
jgi:hypothetical protein